MHAKKPSTIEVTVDKAKSGELPTVIHIYTQYGANYVMWAVVTHSLQGMNLSA
jgi:hypothetical protein